MSDFMHSAFVRACQSTLDYDEGMRRAVTLWATKDPRTWPLDLRVWIAAHCEANVNEEE